MTTSVSHDLRRSWSQWVTAGEFAGFLTLWQPGQPVLIVALIGVLGGLLMAATMAAITGATLANLVKGALSR
jgi:hypothetical protein